jgi:hypothetical protein
MKNEESQAQAAVFKWADMHRNKYPSLRMMFAIPNGGKRSIITATIMKREGAKRGVPDIILLHPSGPYHGLAIEMKKEKGGTVSPEQKEWIKNLTDEGYKATVCRGSTEAIETIKNYLEL